MIKPYHSRDEHGSGLDRTAVFLTVLYKQFKVDVT